MKTDHFQELLKSMAQLRDHEQGCVRDQQQTYQSIVPRTTDHGIGF